MIVISSLKHDTYDIQIYNFPVYETYLYVRSACTVIIRSKESVRSEYTRELSRLVYTIQCWLVYGIELCICFKLSLLYLTTWCPKTAHSLNVH